ncbi:hypothetical protein AMTR_s00053p00105350 [Amborella trichopoda]|uniref:Longin domain-containing protein n=1 Tax=Amborella trichopoda TaxID=13333 RepID=W1PAU1_AMBTC|nr:hypothetical protein AMTR_s00053p00105350 [Amborella trichopoda]
MKITALLLMKCSNDEGSEPLVLASASDVSQFGYFQRTGAKEFILFVGRTVAKRTPPGQRQSVQHEEFDDYDWKLGSYDLHFGSGPSICTNKDLNRQFDLFALWDISSEIFSVIVQIV